MKGGLGLNKHCKESGFGQPIPSINGGMGESGQGMLTIGDAIIYILLSAPKSLLN